MADSDLVKLYSTGILFVMSIISSIVIPFVLVKIISRKLLVLSDTFHKVISALNCFSSGVFVSTALLILLPEAREMMEDALKTLGSDLDFPFTEVLMGVGFLLILMIENVVETCYHRRQKTKVDEDKNDTSPDTNTTTAGHKNGEVVTLSAPSPTPGETTVIIEQPTETGAHVHDHSDSRAIQNITLLLALSIHMVFDGLGIGLLEDPQMIWSMLLAVTIHKVLIFFSLGLNALESTTLCRFIATMVYISAISPIGIGIGMLLSSDKNTTVTVVSGILQSIAAGTFLYVALFEILLRELASRYLKLSKTVFVTIGFCVFAGIVYVNP